MAWLAYIIQQICEALLILLAVAAVDLWRRGYCPEIGYVSLLKLYVIRQLTFLKARLANRQFEKDVQQFDQVQAAFLLDRVRRCENTDFGRDHHFKEISSVAEYRRAVPVTDFYRVKHYVDRMADQGELSALLGRGDQLRMFITSSGTTGVNKRIPMTMQGARDYQVHLSTGAYTYRMLQDTGSWDVRRMMNVANGRTPEFTAAGHELGVVSTVMYDKLGDLFQELFTSPKIALTVKQEFESQYIHMLFGLRDEQLGAIMCAFVHNFLSMMRRMEVYQEDLVNDIRRGRIKEDLDISPEVRHVCNGLLRPLPRRADELRRQFGRGFQGIVPRVWPHCRRVTGLWSGSTNQIYQREARALLGPHIPLVSFNYAASEGLFATNMSVLLPGPPRYTLLPTTNFYEFLPVHDDRIQELEEIRPSDLLLATELSVGAEYELFLTNASGFYRYRVGDVLRVVGFYQQAPQLEFLYRSGQSLNVNGEKLSEEVFFRALRRAAEGWSGVTLRDYTVAGSQFAPHAEGGLFDPHYLLFIEADGAKLNDDQLGAVDRTLREQDDEYASFRKLGKIAEMKIYRMPSGTFARFKQHLLDTTPVSANQFKMPRVLKTSQRVQWFLEHVESGKSD